MLLFGELGRAVTQASGARPSEPGSAHPTVVQAMRLLEADLARAWTLTGLAAELHLAPGYLVRLLNVATGLPPMAYLAQLRATTYRKRFATGAAHLRYPAVAAS